MKFVKLVKASEDWEVEKINENDWVIKSPDGTYKNSNGKDYHFKTKEDALEELDYLRAEHKFDKKSADEEDKKINKQINDLLKECRDMLNWYYEQGKNENMDDYNFDNTDKMYNLADLETLKEIKTKIQTLFTR